ncbi:hypothetical protein M422DRAFT_74879 [Sphaerobolus stellatus SS14]|uniref:Unplaced genomic scaffold SPHSTscaffold_31, whole genome shotgun sequence n=1 Tax=Sphaerobolus stellatus (strain SS14) TaxID=990650 RepID=A0A0C9W4U4_SPHS4|nr:hypothetical protein M422DRAFT_74879 [Sphaerobolus stellatus SS14]
MAPANSKPQLKQKTLLSFFAKANTSTSSASKPKDMRAKVEAKSKDGDSAKGSSDKSKAPKNMNVSNVQEKSSRRDSSAGRSSKRANSLPCGVKEVPSTCGPIYVHVLSDAEDELKVVDPPRKRKKALLIDSEDEDARLSRDSMRLYSSHKSSSSRVEEPTRCQAQSKASSTRGCRGSRADDDDFIVPNDSEVSYSGAIDIDAASDFELDDQHIQKSKYKPADEPEKKKSFVKKPTGTKSAATGSQSLMLTAAEQRALEKNNKQNKEDFFSFLVDVRDKDKNRPGDPNYDSRTLYIPPSAWKNFTPIEKQKGKFIELYEDDARIGNRVFDLKLTSRVKMVMAGFPLMSFNFWAAKFLAKGYKEIYQVETSANQKDIPKDWKKTGSNKAVKRWSVPALAGNIRKLQEARERRNTVIKEYKYRIYGEFDVDRAIWLRAVKVVAELDCLFSLAKSSVALGEPACKPTFLKGDFIPNDVRLGDKVGRIMLLTGPNMALAPADSILTRMGAYDNMFSNSSTFKVELDECCKILRDATPKSLVILDELGRGTSTFDGMAIAEAVLHELATHTLPLSCFATHYPTLTDDFAHHPNIRNMHMQTMVDDEKRELLFLYKLVEGVATGSFGTHVANLAGVPMDVVMRAETISNDFAQKFREKQAEKKRNAIPLLLQADFAFLLKLATGAISADADRYKMAETLKILNKFVKNQTL